MTLTLSGAYAAADVDTLLGAPRNVSGDRCHAYEDIFLQPVVNFGVDRIL